MWLILEGSSCELYRSNPTNAVPDACYGAYLSLE